MTEDIRKMATTDKDIHLSYESGTRTEHSTGSSNDKTVEHMEHQGMVPVEETDFTTWGRIRRHMQEPFSEFFGVFILILFGDGVVAQVVLSGSTKGDYQSISWGWG